MDLDGVNAMVSLLLYQLRGFEELVQQLGEHEATQHILLDYWSHWLARAGETRRLCDVAAVHMAGDGEKERKVQMEKLMGDIAEVVDKIAAGVFRAHVHGISALAPLPHQDALVLWGPRFAPALTQHHAAELAARTHAIALRVHMLP